MWGSWLIYEFLLCLAFLNFLILYKINKTVQFLWNNKEVTEAWTMIRLENWKQNKGQIRQWALSMTQTQFHFKFHGISTICSLLSTYILSNNNTSTKQGYLYIPWRGIKRPLQNSTTFIVNLGVLLVLIETTKKLLNSYHHDANHKILV